MGRMFWFVAGIVMGIFGYRYYRQQGGSVPTLEELQVSGRQVFETAKTRAANLQPSDVTQMAQSATSAAKEAATNVQQRMRTMASGFSGDQSGTAPGDTHLREDVTHEATPDLSGS